MLRFQKKLPLWADLLLLFALSIPILLLCIALQPGDFFASFENIWSRPYLMLLNWLPVFLTAAVGSLLLGNVWWGSGIAALLWPALSYVNLLKIEGREDAFVPADLGLIREGFNSAAEYSLELHLPWLIGFLLFGLLLIAAGFFLGSKLRWQWRALGGGLAVALCVLSMVFIYPSKAIYNGYKVPNMYNIPSVFNTLGFNYCFLYNFNLYPIDKPEGYRKGDVQGWIEEYTTEPVAPATKPNIVMVMGEAFSDLANAAVFDWATEQENPIHLYNQLAQSGQAICGHINVSNIAAGTANTEFDVLTGMPTTMIGETTTSSFRVVRNDLPTIASVLKEQGYENRFLHPGNSWFYNRNNVYRYFGIEQQTFREAFDMETDTVGGMITDAAFLRQLKAELEAGADPQFFYGVTIQNHQTYNYAKYPDPTADVPLKTAISADAMEYLSVYLRGTQDTAKMIYELAQYLDASEEPTLLVFFGDHLPNLGPDYLTYRELGLPMGSTASAEETFAAYETPFMIYANKAYCQENDFTAAAAALELGEDPLINSNYLGAMTLELAGWQGLDPYFDFLNDARRVLPAFRAETAAYRIDGKFTDQRTPQAHQIIRKIDHWEYYRLKK